MLHIIVAVVIFYFWEGVTT